MRLLTACTQQSWRCARHQAHLSRWYCAVAWAASVRGVSVSPCFAAGEVSRRGRSARVVGRRSPRYEAQAGRPHAQQR